MSLGECPRISEDCPYFNRPAPPELAGQDYGCFSDTDHIYPQRLATNGLSRAFIRLTENKQQICRWEHELKSQMEPEELPPQPIMVDLIVNSCDPPSPNKLRKLGIAC